MSEEITEELSEEEEIGEDSSDDLTESTKLVDVSLDEILEYAYDEGIETNKVDAWIAENFITEDGDEEGVDLEGKEFEGYGRISLRANPDAPLPDGVPWPITIVADGESYQEGYE